MNRTVTRWKHAFGNALVSGTVASITSTIALSMLGKAELDKSAAPINGPSQWLWGQHAPYQNHFSLRYTVVGYLIHHAASVFWATWYEKLRPRLPPADNAVAVVAPATVVATAAYAVDFHLTPQRLTPGFEHRLSNPSLLTVYGAFALGLAATTLLRRYSKSRKHA